MSTSDDIRIPDDLASYIQTLFKIKRFAQYSGGIFVDNTGSHIISGLGRIQRLDLNSQAKQVLSRIFLIHDIPEIAYLDIGHDVEAPIKEADKKLDKSTSIFENTTAKKLLSSADYKLYLEYEKASALLKGETESVDKVIPEAVVAKIIDLVDGNNLFHEQLSAWAVSDKYDPSKMPEIRALSFTINTYQTYRANLSNIGMPNNFRKVCKDLLTQQLSWVIDHWNTVPGDRIPKEFSDKLDWAKVEKKRLQTDLE